MPAPGAINITTEMFERPYAAYHEQSSPPAWFRSIPPTYSGPALITFPGNLNALERAEVNAWLNAMEGERPATLARCTQRASIAKITEYVAYYADASYLAWKNAADAAHIAQWRLYLADALLANKSTIAKTADTAGSGSAEAAVPYTQGTNLT